MNALQLAARLEKHHSVANDDSAAAMLRKQQAAIVKLRIAMDKLARLGNEPHFGNSIGNQIAQQALKATEEFQ